MADRSDQPALVRGQVALGVVLDDCEIMPLRQRQNGIEIGRQPENTYRNDRFREGRDLALNVCRVDVEGVRVAVGKDGHRAALDDDKRGGRHGQRGHDHLIAGTYARGQQTGQKRA